MILEIRREHSAQWCISIAQLLRLATFVDWMPMKACSTLVAQASELYRDLEMGQLPVALQRNSLDYYYLSIYPGLKQMDTLDVASRPKYPKRLRSAYVHIPFCSGVCSFCSYFLTTLDSNEPSAIQRYLELVRRELTLHAERTELDLSYLYFGGGTPSLVPPSALAELFEFLDSHSMLASPLYGTFELHPEFFGDLDKAQRFIDVLIANGITRVSVGLQSSDPRLLDRTNRRHDETFIANAIAFLRQNSMLINVDLMYGLPGMTFMQWEHSLVTTVSYAPDSISAYFLFVDPGTAMYRDVASAKIALPSHEEVQVQHIMAQRYLEEQRYSELPNDYFALGASDPETFTVTTLASEAASLPIGPGAYGYFDGTQFANVFNLARYRDRIMSGDLPIWRGYRFDDDGLMRRDLMFAFKNDPYLDFRLFEARYGAHPLTRFAPQFELLDSQGLVVVEDTRGRATLTAKGRLCVEEIACLFRSSSLAAGEPPSSHGERRLLEKHHFAPTYGDLPVSGSHETAQYDG